MPRAATRVQKGFIWIPRGSYTIRRDITISGVSVLGEMLSAEFTRSLAPETGDFKIELINLTGKYNNLAEDDEVILYLDFTDGTTVRFKGKIDNIKLKVDQVPKLEISGGHVSGALLDTMVTETYTGEKTSDEVLKELISKYLSGYTSTNISSSTTKPTFSWNAKPFWDCVAELCDITEYDCYVDDDLDFHFFAKNSVENSNEAIVWNDTLISMDSLEERNVNKKNKILVMGEDTTGLPILSTYGTGAKEMVIQDQNIKNLASADEKSAYEYKIATSSAKEGQITCFILPSLQPGDVIWISNPVQKVLGQYKIYSYTHKFYEGKTEVYIEKKKVIPNLFKDRINKEQALETITNPYRMTDSWNFTFDDFTQLSSWDTNVSVSDSNLFLSSGTEGTATTVSKNTSSSVTQVHLVVKGESLSNVVFQLSTDGGTTFEDLVQNGLTNLTNSGTGLVLKIKIRGANVVLDGLALLYK
jgi:hypothetical protein